MTNQYTYQTSKLHSSTAFWRTSELLHRYELYLRCQLILNLDHLVNTIGLELL